ncbi:hypothetical protein CYMTET_30986 [Cymbomonas tetramitiformis]|uniref:Uncharacterized protein n=1 Tax=Cymbomonas tetramitiformis TaxID=36881 RepID=A0AAE0KTE4_9CHLO|nr:hypothetical protein CYMTET_30986 [Cymbomonas tetramitiformis]
MDVAIVSSLLVVNHTTSSKPPSGGDLDTSSPLGWMGSFGAVLIFGFYGVLLKKPDVQAANLNPLVFQFYYSTGCAITSVLVWLISDLQEFSFSYWGFVFGLTWVSSQVCAYQAIAKLGYAAGPAIWAGLTIVVSFVWGVAAFHNSVRSILGAVGGLLVLIVGICIAASASSSLPATLEARFRKSGDYPIIRSLEEQFLEERYLEGGADKSAQNFASGVFWAVATGLLNGSQMVPLQCFSNGCFGSPAYTGSAGASVAFLPSLAVGVMTITPAFAIIYFGAKREVPEFAFSVAGVPGLLTGAFWAMGNFAAMFATEYLGQTIGFPMTQACIIVNAFLGIVFYREITGTYAIRLFAVAVIFIIVGAGLDGNFG